MSTYALPILQEYGLTRYIEEVAKFPMLDEQEEYMLAVRYKETQDKFAAHKLVTSHLRLVVKIAMGFRGYGLPINDIISEGNVGLMQAVKKFEPDKGFRLSTYAMWWIKASINEYILKSWSVVKVGTSAAQKKLFFNLKRLKSKITGERGNDNNILSDDDVKSIATELNVTTEDVVEMEQLMSGGNYSLNTYAYQDGEEEKIDLLEDTRQNQEVVLANQQEGDHNRAMLLEAFKLLTDREKDIIKKRRLFERPLTLDDLSVEYKISRERVRQIEVKAFEKIQKFFLKKLPKPA
ncbi:MAG TPA: RNA polymerase sigma factor RpoH [Alphaproteobacteria bacterium]|nr:RNA polymerase sigma factor RpoH [Alphaproteobacteria bacterium]